MCRVSLVSGLSLRRPRARSLWWTTSDLFTVISFMVYYLCNTRTGVVSQVTKWVGALSYRPRKQERKTKFDIFTKLSEPSFQAVWLYITVLSDV